MLSSLSHSQHSLTKVNFRKTPKSFPHLKIKALLFQIKIHFNVLIFYIFDSNYKANYTYIFSYIPRILKSSVQNKVKGNDAPSSLAKIHEQEYTLELVAGKLSLAISGSICVN